MGFAEVIQAEPQTKPFTWPKLATVSEDHISLMLKCGRQPRVWTQTYGTRRFRLSGPIDVQIETLPVRCAVQFGDIKLSVRADRDALAALFRIQDVKIDAATLSARSASMVLEASICDLIAPLEETLGGAFEVLEYSPTEPEEQGSFVGVSVQSGSANPVQLAIFGAIPDLHTIADIIAVQGHPKQVSRSPDVAFVAQFFGPDFYLTADQLSELAPGSGFILEQRWDQRRAGWMTIQDHLFATINHHENGVKMSSSLLNPTAPTTELPTPPSGTGSPQTSGLPVTIGVQLAERMIQLSEIQGLSSGSVIKLDEPITTDVTLRANGAHFATAELVELDGKVAVKIKQIG